MSSGGQRGIDLSGITSMRLQFASDVTKRTKVRLVYQTFASTTGANAYLNETPNGNDSYVEFLQGIKESCSNCTGLPWQKRASRSFRT
jgi:hypothetical protein